MIPANLQCGLSALILIVAVQGIGSSCKATSSLKSTTPVANLQTYQVALVRVDNAPGLDQFASQLELASATSIRHQCSFQRIVGVAELGDLQPDLIVDLNIRASRRGGSGFIKNDNLATVNVAMVLSDGIDQSLLGSAEIIGSSSLIQVGSGSPEEQALTEVANRISVLLANSGCYGQRVARYEQPQETYTVVGPAAVTDEQRQRADTANEEGKRLFRAANIPAAKVQFQLAIELVQDPRYLFNLCLAQEALSEFSAAMQTCNVVAQTGSGRLADKARQRLAIISDKQG